MRHIAGSFFELPIFQRRLYPVPYTLFPDPNVMKPVIHAMQMPCLYMPDNMPNTVITHTSHSVAYTVAVLEAAADRAANWVAVARSKIHSVLHSPSRHSIHYPVALVHQPILAALEGYVPAHVSVGGSGECSS